MSALTPLAEIHGELLALRIVVQRLLGQMAEMFDVGITAVSKHLKRIFAEGELQENSVVALKAITASDGKSYEAKIYDLNAIISVGYRVESRHGTFFRIWATDKLFQYLTKGFVMDDERLKDPDGRPKHVLFMMHPTAVPGEHRRYGMEPPNEP